jgi:poly-gamma-glutamate capsule biosynthesis protein CapA/YwtB (metallophosphatase superfamily)
MRGVLVAVVCSLLSLPACQGPSDVPAAEASIVAPSVRLIFGGDVMLGRGLAPIVRDDPASILAGIALQLRDADVAIANLESPLTRRPHAVDNPNALEAAPGAARLLAAGGFDAMVIANNHASDAGPGTVEDTVAALDRVGVRAIGETTSAVVIERHGISVALLAFDTSATNGGQVPFARWRPRSAHAAVRDAATRADVVVVSLHGGLDYNPAPDAFLGGIARRLARWGADVVWCHGPHVVQPVRSIDPDLDGRMTVVATSLGNLVFDEQGIPGTDEGVLLEVRADAAGVSSFREGATTIESGRVAFDSWRPPEDDAVFAEGSWWAAARPIPPVPAVSRPRRLPTYPGDGWVVVDSALGDVNGDGRAEVVVSFRWPFSPSWQTAALPQHRWADRNGMEAVIGIYDGTTLTPSWISSSVLRPVARVVPCGSGLVVAYSTLDDPTTVATGLWPWRGYGFTYSVDLPGSAVPGCVDVDGDGIADPVVTGRSSP